jgi:hypothetical protein
MKHYVMEEYGGVDVEIHVNIACIEINKIFSR